MLFETLKQSYIFLGAVYFGILVGVIKEAFLFVENIFKRKKVATFILDFLFMIIFALVFVLCINIVNYGEFRIYLLASFWVGYFLERKSIGFLVAFLIKRLYNLLLLGGKRLIKIKFIKRLIGYDTKTSKEINKNR